MQELRSDFDITNICLPRVFSRKLQSAIERGELATPEYRVLFIREAVSYFEARLQRPTSEQYIAISRKFCDEYPALKNSHHTNYWVGVCVSIGSIDPQKSRNN